MTLILLAACGGSDKEGADTAANTSAPEPFSLDFLAVARGEPVDCTTEITGLGPSGGHSLGISDLRFYVSNLRFLDAEGAELDLTHDANDYQYQGTSGWVGLIDLTGTEGGSCEGGAISFSEGTPRTNSAIVGTTQVDQVARVSFDVGVPQALMKEIIGSNTPEGAPSPLGEMMWSWATGYRHLVLNATASDGVADGEGYLHVGSTDCSGEGELALESRERCGFVNTPQVELSTFDLRSDRVSLDVVALVEGLDFLAPVYDLTTFEVIGEQPGVECHSSPMQEDCDRFFANLGVDLSTGAASAPANTAFGAFRP